MDNGVLICAFDNPDNCIECPFCRVNRYRDFECWVSDIALSNPWFDKNPGCPLLETDDATWDAVKTYIEGRKES